MSDNEHDVFGWKIVDERLHAVHIRGTTFTVVDTGVLCSLDDTIAMCLVQPVDLLEGVPVVGAMGAMVGHWPELYYAVNGDPVWSMPVVG